MGHAITYFFLSWHFNKNTFLTRVSLVSVIPNIIKYLIKDKDLLSDYTH